MRAFTVQKCDEGPVEGLFVDQEKYPHISVGGGGHGRSSWIPVGRDDFPNTERERITRCYPHFKKNDGNLMIIGERRRTSKQAMVLLKVRGGRRGATYIRTEDGDILHQIGEDVRRSYGVQLLARGHDTEGGEGLTGGPHHQALVVLHEGACVCIERLGRIKDGPTKFWVRWLPDQGGLLTGTLADIFPDNHTEEE
jgi:hypothetical protein